MSLYANVLVCNTQMMLNACAPTRDDTNMNTPANLAALMRLNGLSEGELSRRTGVPQPTIHRILKGKSADPRESTLRPLASAFKVTASELRDLDTAQLVEKASRRVREPLRAYDVRPVEAEHEIDDEREVLVDEVDILVSGGPGAWSPEYVETRYRMPYQMNWFRSIGAKPDDVKVMRVIGHSMERTLFDGDRIAVNTGDTRLIDGRVYVFIAGGPEGGVKVKRLFTTADGRIRVVSDNPDKTLYPDEFLTSAEMDQFLMIGRVVDRSGRGGL